MMKYSEPFHENCLYHIFNQGNARVKIFYKKENYGYFLKKLDLYMSDVLDIYCFCLIPNHFHLLAGIKDWKEIEPNLKKHKNLEKIIENKDYKVEIVVSELFRRFLCHIANQ